MRYEYLLPAAFEKALAAAPETAMVIISAFLRNGALYPAAGQQLGCGYRTFNQLIGEA